MVVSPLARRTSVRYCGWVLAAAHVTTTIAGLVPAADRCLPVDEALASMLPDAGLSRGKLVGCSGPAAWSLALALLARAVATGSWLAVVGAPAFGIEAAGELGVALERVVLIDAEPATWAERVAAAADGFELIATSPPPGAERTMRKVRQRVQARGAVLIAVGASNPGVACDLDFTTSAVEWQGIGQGAGHLMARRVAVELVGRRIPRPVLRELLLPGPDGGLSCDHTIVQHDRAAG
jgi:hypothetical protein